MKGAGGLSGQRVSATTGHLLVVTNGNPAAKRRHPSCPPMPYGGDDMYNIAFVEIH
jgi:hypothetical protein